MGNSFRQFRPLLVALVFGGVFTTAIAVATIYVTWSSTKPATGDNRADGMRSGSTPGWFRETALEVEERRAVKWVEGPLFHAAIVTRYEQTGSDPREVQIHPGRLADAFIKVGFPWPWFERHDESIARTLFAADNPWLKAEFASEYMVFEESFQPGFAIDYQFLIADIVFFGAVILGFLALASAVFRGGSFCGMPPWIVAALSFGVVLPVVFAWMGGMMIVSPTDTRYAMIDQDWIIEDERRHDSAAPFISESVRAPGAGASMTTAGRRRNEESTRDQRHVEIALQTADVSLGWPMPIARSGDPIHPLLANTWVDALRDLRGGGYLELDHASIWKVIRAPVVWSGWFLNWLAWSAIVALVLAPGIAARRWRRETAGRCVACGHRLAGADHCFECGSMVECR